MANLGNYKGVSASLNLTSNQWHYVENSRTSALRFSLGGAQERGHLDFTEALQQEINKRAGGWKVCRYLGTCDGKELHGEPIWDFVFPTRKAAESYWYDSAPGRNDRCTFVKVSAWRER